MKGGIDRLQDCGTCDINLNLRAMKLQTVVRGTGEYAAKNLRYLCLVN